MVPSIRSLILATAGLAVLGGMGDSKTPHDRKAQSKRSTTTKARHDHQKAKTRRKMQAASRRRNRAA